jgi:hypothetical protein
MMGHLPVWSPARTRTPQPWPRRRTRRWVRTGDIATAGMLLAALPSLPRAELARLTERLIDQMDMLDGDPDLEVTSEDDEPEEDVDPAHDDGCGPVVINGRQRWGSEEDERGQVIPTYGVDQSTGPTVRQSGHRDMENRHD